MKHHHKLIMSLALGALLLAGSHARTWTSADGHAASFDALEPRIAGDELEKESREELARRLGIEVAALAARRTKLKQQLRTKVCDKVAETLRQPTDADIKNELDALLQPSDS